MSNKNDLGPHPDFPECNVSFDETAGFYRTFPYPSEAALERFYTKEYREIREEKPDESYIHFMRHRAKAQTDFILRATGQRHFGTVIDIGCGCGELLNALAPHADQLYGFETDSVMAQYAIANRRHSGVSITNAHFIPDRHKINSDLIVMSHVLEHIPNPGDFLSHLRRTSLNTGAHLFIEVPNEADIWVRHQIKWSRRGLGHINYFTPQSLKQLFASSGFSDITVRECGKLLSQHITSCRPAKNRLHRITRRIKKYFEVTTQTPDYISQGGESERIYLQLIAKNLS